MPEVVEKPFISISNVAIEHFNELIAQEEVQGMGLRIFVDQPGIPMAEIGISFCPPGEEKKTDIPIEQNGFTLFVDKASSVYLEGAEVTFISDNLGGQLSITAPNLKGSKPENDSPLYERVNYFLNTEVNPNLASHGGVVTLVEITNDMVVVLRFGGGCHGCGMVDVTLKEGIEKSLIGQFPEIKAVKDITDHASGENPYYES